MDKKPKRMVPEVRFKGFTDDWEQRKLGEVLTEFQYGLNTPAISFNGIDKYIRITDIDENTHRFNVDNITSPKETNDDYLLTEGDILFARTGASVGKTYIYNSNDGKIYYAGFLIKGHIRKNYDSRFVFETTLLSRYTNFVKITSIRSGQPGINANEYKKYTFYTPTLNEQRLLSTLMQKLEKLLSLQQRKLEQLKQLKKAMLQRLLVSKKGKLISNIRFKDFTETWEQRKFGDIANRESKQIESTSDIPSVEYDDIVSNQGNLNKDISTKKAKKKGIEFNDTNVLYGKLRPYLHNWLNASFTGVAVGDWWVLKPVKIRKNFLYYLIQTKKYDNVANLSSGSKMPRSDWNLVSNTAFSIPNTEEEQEKIGIFLSDLESLITLHQRKLNQLSKIKKFCLQKMFI